VTNDIRLISSLNGPLTNKSKWVSGVSVSVENHVVCFADDISDKVFQFWK